MFLNGVSICPSGLAHADLYHGDKISLGVSSIRTFVFEYTNDMVTTVVRSVPLETQLFDKSVSVSYGLVLLS